MKDGVRAKQFRRTLKGKAAPISRMHVERKADSVRLISTSHFHNPLETFADDLNRRLDPVTAPSKPKTFRQMTEAEREEMRRLYEKKGTKP